MDPLAALKRNIDRVLEYSKKQDEKLGDIQKNLALLAKRVDHIEELNHKSESGSIKVPRELSVNPLHICV